MILKSIMKSDIWLRKQLFESIILSGGTTMMPGTSTRILKDIREKHKEMRAGVGGGSVKIRVEDPSYRKELVFMGGVAFTNVMRETPESWIYKFNWEEDGRRCVHNNRY